MDAPRPLTVPSSRSPASPAVPRIVLRPGKAQPFFNRHPWVFAGVIDRLEGQPADGAEAALYSHQGQFIARGLYNSRSKIRLRLYSWDDAVPLDAAFFRRRLEQAVHLRHHVLQLDRPEAAYRVVFSEADYLSGLVVDRYGQWLVVQFSSLAMAQRQQWWVEWLRELFQPRGIVLRMEKGIGPLEGVELADGLLWGEPPLPELTIVENGLRFRVDLLTGQKTGFYLDQRDNRAAVGRLCRGRRVLDAFCYSGGFALHAAAAGATEVLGLDGSAAALELARANAALNGLADRVRWECVDVFDHLAELVRRGERFDAVILDPPKFAHRREAVPRALQGYRRLYQLALQLLAPDGLLVFCCCTGLIVPEQLEELLAQAAVAARRDVQVLERRGAAPDHPAAATCRQTAYLKCLIGRVY